MPSFRNILIKCRAKQQCENLINRPRRNPFVAIGHNQVGWILGRPSGPSHGETQCA
ncbi:hypothetical protein IXB28_08370 [Leptothoe kymatousa TAU-MAC 1615]|uniref:Uncharacterized protein n=1 Tax=Leptothoe kymatousa TAU-MAC 1615 TaxID=2364775 RepID=A0ABS5Y338_9CYAN|nr:hypothetical protein [Leptothoe kymatousa TAU-MAC 1615]